MQIPAILLDTDCLAPGMPVIHPSHFEMCLLFALFTSTVLGIVSKRTARLRLEYAIYCFICFIVTVFALGSLMQLGHG